MLTWDRPQFKATGRSVFQSNYWPFVAVSLLLMFALGDGVSVDIISEVRSIWASGASAGVSAPATIVAFFFTNDGVSEESLTNAVYALGTLAVPFIGSIGLASIALDLLVFGPIEVGASRFFLENANGGPVGFSRVAWGFTANFGNVVLTQFLRKLFIFLWSLLFVIPGIVRSYGYFAVPFLLAENPQMDHNRALRLSLEMTRGFKWSIFVTHLSFIGWLLLSAITLNIVGIFYVYPYMNATDAEMYRFLRENALRTGIATYDELPGTGNVLP